MPVLYGAKPAQPLLGKLEAELGFVLPADYKDFLKKWNGIFIGGADYLDFDFPGVDNGIISFASLFGVGTSNENFDLIEQNERVRGEVDFLNDFFVIGDDPGGNYYALARFDNVEKVLYWDRTHLHADDTAKPDIAEVSECGNLYNVADGFSAFLNMIVAGTQQMQFVAVDDWPG
ncbi:SMI1/KNR4 family protein [Burkholderia cenocepacia]|uniref:Knr4/Smi1-like domain-containing protein n=1 Tax=Burkholderia cenocepacia (strain ATCC BAA-245 / DSM 16553 / LMG 16656 / NCTC 13227 / J2315 / CF5610) TaxID=216591 RepID=B4EP56_BURCJ|nr:SMI1/KNR4 family protein [Burkholderia cenocepacia]KIS52861.1 SMI1-KNR4 cell-wall family protein [Burkholderia cepacia]EPZ85131.1 SMI1/KNR4 family protein [Burkholderia cenocepacia K56-2Valvano]ERI25034.1 SMI1/KNR4 family protein [Burkholderia cenocepacia BC7]PNE66755.1 SMI1/KNR4 family protein [Burkholderia cenocepacia]QKT93731.1 SMI1/KNR4 family protein [Burkholderia cenocepacia]